MCNSSLFKGFLLPPSGNPLPPFLCTSLSFSKYFRLSGANEFRYWQVREWCKWFLFLDIKKTGMKLSFLIIWLKEILWVTKIPASWHKLRPVQYFRSEHYLEKELYKCPFLFICFGGGIWRRLYGFDMILSFTDLNLHFSLISAELIHFCPWCKTCFCSYKKSEKFMLVPARYIEINCKKCEVSVLVTLDW